MNRRGLLGALAAACVLDPERALWVPGAKVISIPAPPVMRFWPPLFWPNDGRVEHWSRAPIGCRCPLCAAPKIGDTIFVRRPQRFVPYDPQPFRSDVRLFTRIA